MRVLVAGASGVLGRPTVRQLRAAGHEVVGLARSAASAETVAALGAASVRGDVLDAASVLAAARGADAVLNLVGTLPAPADGRAIDWNGLDRTWRAGTRNLLDAARAADAELFVQASLGLLYGDHGDAWVTEETPLAEKTVLAAARAAEDAVAEAGRAGLPTVILRLGTVYARDAWHTRLLAEQARQGALPVLGDGAAYWSLLHAEDAAAGMVRALEDAQAGTVYNVCDDRPVRMAELFAAIARLLGGRPPSRVPGLVARAVVGADVVRLLTTSVRLSNRAIRQDLELDLRFPTYEDGLREALGTRRSDQR